MWRIEEVAARTELAVEDIAFGQGDDCIATIITWSTLRTHQITD